MPAYFGWPSLAPRFPSEFEARFRRHRTELQSLHAERDARLEAVRRELLTYRVETDAKQFRVISNPIWFAGMPGPVGYVHQYAIVGRPGGTPNGEVVLTQIRETVEAFQREAALRLEALNTEERTLAAEAAGVPAPAGMDGRSFLPLLTGAAQPGRDHVFTCYNDTSGRKAYPMRCLQTQRFGYIFNAWSDGQTAYRSEAMAGQTFPAMQKAAASDKAIAGRVELLVHRVPEELYDFAADPDALHNLATDPKHRAQLQQMRGQMRAWMEQTQDPLIVSYRAKVPVESKP